MKTTRRACPLTTAQLQKIIARWDDGSGVTATVQEFAKAVPVAERTVWYWLGGRQIHPAMAARIRSLELPVNPTLRGMLATSPHRIRPSAVGGAAYLDVN